MLTKDLIKTVRALLLTLTPKEDKIIRMRFGIQEKSEHTLEEIGQVFGVTRERIRQIEHKTLGKLKRQASRLHYLLYS